MKERARVCMHILCASALRHKKRLLCSTTWVCVCVCVCVCVRERENIWYTCLYACSMCVCTKWHKERLCCAQPHLQKDEQKTGDRCHENVLASYRVLWIPCTCTCSWACKSAMTEMGKLGIYVEKHVYIHTHTHTHTHLKAIALTVLHAQVGHQSAIAPLLLVH